MFRFLHRWWTRRCGGREVLALALPLFVSTMSNMVMMFIDRMFLTWYSTDAVAAAMPAFLICFCVGCLPMGVAAYANTFVAQYAGAGRPRQIGPVVWQGIWIGVLATPVLIATAALARLPFTLAGHEPVV